MKRKHASPQQRRDLHERPFDVNEAICRRRARRMGRNLAREETARQQAAALGFQLAVHNDGHHWLLRNGGFTAEWWPSSAKLVLNRDYGRNIHAHDWLQVLSALREHRATPGQGWLF